MPVQGECHEVAVVETLSDAHGLAEQRVRRDDLTVAHTLARERAKQPSLFHAGLFACRRSRRCARASHPAAWARCSGTFARTNASQNALRAACEVLSASRKPACARVRA